MAAIAGSGTQSQSSAIRSNFSSTGTLACAGFALADRPMDYPCEPQDRTAKSRCATSTCRGFEPDWLSRRRSRNPSTSDSRRTGDLSRLPESDGPPNFGAARRSCNLPVEFQTILELAERFIYSLDCVHAVAAKIMGGVFQVRLSISKCANRFPDFGVGLRQSCGRSRWLGGCGRNCGGRRGLGRCWGCRHRQAKRQCKNHQGGKTQNLQFHCTLHHILDFLAGSRKAPRRYDFSALNFVRNASKRVFVASVHNGCVASLPPSF